MMGTNEMINAPNNALAWPQCSTAYCPISVEHVRPNQKKLLVIPTVVHPWREKLEKGDSKDDNTCDEIALVVLTDDIETTSSKRQINHHVRMNNSKKPPFDAI